MTKCLASGRFARNLVPRTPLWALPGCPVLRPVTALLRDLRGAHVLRDASCGHQTRREPVPVGSLHPEPTPKKGREGSLAGTQLRVTLRHKSVGMISPCEPLNLVKLTALMERTRGSRAVTIGLIDGPVAIQHPDLAGQHLQDAPADAGGACRQTDSAACLHGTFIAGILSAARDCPSPGICPDCRLLIRPVFAEASLGSEGMPVAAPERLAAAISQCIDEDARRPQSEPRHFATLNQGGVGARKGA